MRTQNKVSVAHLTTVHHPFDPRIFHKECKTLRDAGYDVHLVAPHEHDEPVEGIHVTALLAAEGRYRRLALHPRMYRIARDLDAALYHFHDPELIPIAYALKRATGAAVVYDMHEDYHAGRRMEGRLLRLLERWCFRWVDHVVISDAAYADITAGTGAPTTLVANYFKSLEEAPEEKTGRVADEPFRLVYTGVISEARGLGNLLDLAALFKERAPTWQLEIAGVCYLDGERERAERRIHRDELGEVICRTDWRNYLPHRDLLSAYRRAHVGGVLMNPQYDYQRVVPTKFYEYLHFGLPILCSDFPLWRRFIERHQCGAVVPPGDAEAAYRVLRQWADDPARYEERAQAAREAATQYRWAEMGQRLVQVYDHLLAS